MKALKPYVSEIRAKYKDNQDAQNRAIGKLYEDAKQNPLAGCLVSLVQLPVFLGLYRGVRNLANLGELQEPFLWIPSLEGPVGPPNYQGLDWLIQGWTTAPDGGLPIPSLGWETTLAFLAMPIVLVVLQSATMQVLQPPLDENATPEERETLEKSQGILKYLPLLIGFFSLQVPAGLTIYWLTSNIFTLAQSLSVRAYFAANPPKIELPEYWENALKANKAYENMTPEERRQASEAGISVGPKFEDLIDEAQFHVALERGPMRTETEVWQRVTATTPIPAPLQTWVVAAANTTTTMTTSSSTSSVHHFMEEDHTSSEGIRSSNTTAVTVGASSM
jgi:YidC/Oxa1 family membrane protein insertase